MKTSFSSKRASASFLSASVLLAFAVLSSCGDGADGTLRVATESLPAASAGAAYSEQLSAKGGTGPLVWSLEAPASLAWLKLTADGRLNGTPQEIQRPAVAFTVSVKDASGKTATRELSIEVQSCVDGTTRECGVALGETCMVGTQYCDGGRFSTCADGAPSVDVVNCGPSCLGCGDRGDACADGSCRCGDGAGCEAEGANGCCGGECVDRTTNLANCGACGNSCLDRDGDGQEDVPAGTAPACQDGACAFPCAAGHARCDATAESCQNVMGDTANCGACGNVCNANLANVANATCVSGTCGAQCKVGFMSCDGNLSNGCEINTQADASNCGNCGNVCQRPNTAPSCAQGQCQYACLAGFADVDGDPANGCETNLMTNPLHCGSIGNVCPTTGTNVIGGTCSAGRCQLVCKFAYSNCNGNAADGCETNTTLNKSHCGQCNNACVTGDQCRAGSCCTPDPDRPAICVGI